MRRDVFNALADPTRRAILMSLSKKEYNVNSLAEKFDMTRQAVSLHVKYLNECQVISIRKEGRERYCQLKAETLAQAADWLEPFRELWEARFNALDGVLKEMKSKNQ